MTGEVKIRELPITESSKVLDSNLMIVELNDDTYAIRIDELKVLFSADKKILAVQQELIQTITQIQQQLTGSIITLSETVTSNSQNISGINEYIEKNKSNISTIQQNIKSLKEFVDTTTETLNSITTTIDEYANILADHSNALSILSDTTQEHTNSIETMTKDIQTNADNHEQLQSKYSEYTSNNNLIIEELKKTDIDNLRIAKKYSDDNYDDIMQYIDYYHHYTETPPNFDEPFYYEKELAGYVYPIGTLYRTTNKDWDPENYKVPGDWILRTTVQIENGFIEYIYERIG